MIIILFDTYIFIGKSVSMDVLKTHIVNGVFVSATLDIPKPGDNAVTQRSQK